MTIHCHIKPRPLARFSIDREALHPALAFLVKSIVERRNTVPIVSNVAIVAEPGFVTIRATDLDIQASFTLAADVEAPGAFTVEASALADVVRKADKRAYIGLEDTGEGRALIKHGRSRANLATLPIDDMPRLPDRETVATLTYDGPTLFSDLSRLAPFMSKDEARYYLQGVAVHPLGDTLALTATSGAVLARIERAAPPCDGEMPREAIISQKTVAAVLKLAKGRAGNIGLAFADGRIMIDIGAARIEAKLIDGTFPDMAAFLDKVDACPRQRLAFYDLEPSLSPATVEMFRKVLGAPPEIDAIDSDAAAFGVSLARAPEFRGILTRDEREKAGGFSYGYNPDSRAIGYLRGLATDRGLHPVGEARIMTRAGMVQGATFGNVTQQACRAGDVIGTRAASEAELAAIAEDSGKAIRTMAARDGLPVRAEYDAPDQYADGAFSIAMPREREEAVCSAVSFTADNGVTYPLRSAMGPNDVPGSIQISADAVRRLAGPIDPATFVDIPTRQFHHGEALAPGWTLPKAKLPKGTDALRMTEAERRGFVESCKPVFVGVPEAPAIEPVAIVEPVVALPAPQAPETAPVDAVEPVAAVSAPIAHDDALAVRVAALEATLARMGVAIGGGAPEAANDAQPRRSDAERRAIMRAWRMRVEAREARASRAALAHRYDVRAAQHYALEAELATVRAQAVNARDAATAYKREGYALERKLWSVEQAASGAERRASRMVRIAADHRKAARRAQDDVRGARAEARALARRLEDAQREAGARNARPMPAPPTDTVMARAFAGARG